jgi:hypothetical protein
MEPAFLFKDEEIKPQRMVRCIELPMKRSSRCLDEVKRSQRARSTRNGCCRANVHFHSNSSLRAFRG